MRYVCLLQSISSPGEHYVGMTEDLKQRLAAHDAGSSPHTSKYRPWRVVVAIRCEADQRAAAFEQYLKSGSGRAFAERHFW